MTCAQTKVVPQIEFFLLTSRVVSWYYKPLPNDKERVCKSVMSAFLQQTSPLSAAQLIPKLPLLSCKLRFCAIDQLTMQPQQQHRPFAI